jgi:peptidoglycan/LPS O-acetylase OafA/YrhL
MTGLRRPIKYRPDIDGMRAVAILAVVVYHAGPRWMPGGFVGVDVFFVISGYLIGTLVYKEIRGNSFSISRFYARRAKRILPALVTVLAVCYAGALLMLPPRS